MSLDDATPALPAAFLTPGTSSFADFLAAQAPDLLPSRRAAAPGQRRPTSRRTAPRSWRRRSPAAW